MMPEPNLKTIPDSMKPWVSVFRQMWADDQRYRIINDMSYLLQNGVAQKQLDSINLHMVDSFFNRYNKWPDKNWVGLLGNRAVSLIIQHADLPYQEKYYPIVKRAWQDKQVAGETFAMLQDRINVKNKRLQLYGSQFCYVNNKQVLYPVANVDSLSIRRKQMGMVSIESYFAMFKLEWNLYTYKKSLPSLMSTLQVNGIPLE